MTNEEMQRVMNFIVEQQAQFVANFQRVEENIRKLEEAQTKSEARISTLESAFVGLYSAITDLTKAQKELTQRVDNLAAAQAHTDERLSALINTFERYISERHNGGTAQ